MFQKSIGLLPKHTMYSLPSRSKDINILIPLFSIPFVNSLEFDILQL